VPFSPEGSEAHSRYSLIQNLPEHKELHTRIQENAPRKKKRREKNKKKRKREKEDKIARDYKEGGEATKKKKRESQCPHLK
jgi:hypothetical protein